MLNNTITLQNKNNVSVTLSSFGASWLSCQLPLPSTDNSNKREILLACKPKDLPKQDAYLGSIVGRYANRIANAQFTLKNVTHHLSANENGNTLHGGADNFAYRYWDIAEQSDNHVTFSLLSENGDQGFPARLSVRVTYTLEENSLIIDYHADTDGDTICALTNHAYFNLDGDNILPTDARKQSLYIPADKYMPVDNTGISVGNLADVTDTPFDFRTARKIIANTPHVPEKPHLKGYDHSWYFSNAGTEKLVAKMQSADQLVSLSLYTTQPTLHVYTGNYLNGIPNRHGGVYDLFSGVALETGCVPNSPNKSDFINDCLVSTDKPYRHRSRYVFDWITE